MRSNFRVPFTVSSAYAGQSYDLPPLFLYIIGGGVSGCHGGCLYIYQVAGPVMKRTFDRHFSSNDFFKVADTPDNEGGIYYLDKRYDALYQDGCRSPF